MHKKIAIFSLVLILILVNWSIFKKEKHLTEGKIVNLELAPVDPRSLMQGDYMVLDFQFANELYKALPKKGDRGWQEKIKTSDGLVVGSLDRRHIATFKNLYEGQMLAKNEILLRYRVRNGKVKFATNAYFFQEGQRQRYQKAQYGQFRVDSKGELLLVHMLDKDLKQLDSKN